MEEDHEQACVEEDAPESTSQEDEELKAGPPTLAEHQEVLLEQDRLRVLERRARVLRTAQWLDARANVSDPDDYVHGLVPREDNPNAVPADMTGATTTPVPMFRGRRGFGYRSEAYGPLTLEEIDAHALALEWKRQRVLEETPDETEEWRLLELGHWPKVPRYSASSSADKNPLPEEKTLIVKDNTGE